MVDAADLKSVDRKIVRVRVPPWAPTPFCRQATGDDSIRVTLGSYCLTETRNFFFSTPFVFDPAMLAW